MMLQTVLDSPWKATNEIWRLLLLPIARLHFVWHGVRWRSGWRIFGLPLIQRHRQSQISIGPGMIMRSWTGSNPLAPNHRVVLATRDAGALIEIGANCGLTGTTIVAAERVTLGDNVQVGANCTIVDTDFHPLTPEERDRDFLAGAHCPVIIEDDVFIGMNSLILKGVTIGRRSVIGAGSVVTRDVPPGVIVAGNPAQFVKEL